MRQRIASQTQLLALLTAPTLPEHDLGRSLALSNRYLTSLLEEYDRSRCSDSAAIAWTAALMVQWLL